MQRAFSNGTNRLWGQSYIPFSNTLIALMVITCLLCLAKVPQVAWLTCFLPHDWLQPWRIWTHPIVQPDPIGLILNGLLVWWGAGSLERSWGTRTIAVFYFAVCLASALATTGLSLLFSMPAPASLGLVTAFLVAWCAINPDENINMYGFIPVKARYLAVATCIILFFSYGRDNLLAGLIALTAPGFAVLWATQGWAYRVEAIVGGNYRPSVPKPRPNLRLVPQKSPKPRDDKFSIRDLNPLEIYARRRRRKQFEKLMRDD